ncbi:hypothetical protein AB4Z22_10265, partial [Paenibacillus sp. TAF58]
ASSTCSSELASVEERSNGTYRELETHMIPSLEYRKKVLEVGETYLSFIKDLDYRPYFGDTVKVVEDLVYQIHQITE